MLREIYVFVRGDDGALWERIGPSTGGFNGWTPIPGNGVLADGTGPSAVCVPQAAGTPTAPASVIVFVEGTNGACWTIASLDALGTQWFGGSTPATGKVLGKPRKRPDVVASSGKP